MKEICNGDHDFCIKGYIFLHELATQDSLCNILRASWDT